MLCVSMSIHTYIHRYVYICRYTLCIKMSIGVYVYMCIYYVCLEFHGFGNHQLHQENEALGLGGLPDALISHESLGT